MYAIDLQILWADLFDVDEGISSSKLMPRVSGGLVARQVPWSVSAVATQPRRADKATWNLAQ